jgi:hypothetical protein
VFFWIFLLVFIFIALVFSIKVRFIIEYNSTFSVTLKILFFKRILFPYKDCYSKNSPLLGLYEVKDSTVDLYQRYGERLKLKRIKISAKIATPTPFFTSLAYGGIYIAISSFLAILDSYFGNASKRQCVNVRPDFLSDSSNLYLELELYITLFSFILASTYSLLKGVFSKQNGGKNGTK